MALNGDPSLSEIANNLWLNYKTLFNRVKGSMSDSISTQVGMCALRRDLKRTRQELDILKKTTACCAS